ncbi:MAG TPA: hypothetical protein VFC61_07615, partial [Blastocatellia bacterium]|nr:hypothetical protein [Blastocatellia bacterium]
MLEARSRQEIGRHNHFLPPRAILVSQHPRLGINFDLLNPRRPGESSGRKVGPNRQGSFDEISPERDCCLAARQIQIPVVVIPDPHRDQEV